VPSFVFSGTHEKAALPRAWERATALEVDVVGQSLHAKGEVEVFLEQGAAGLAGSRATSSARPS
jgi:hypothetical protein